jgi:hypothetical protein
MKRRAIPLMTPEKAYEATLDRSEQTPSSNRNPLHDVPGDLLPNTPIHNFSGLELRSSQASLNARPTAVFFPRNTSQN